MVETTAVARLSHRTYAVRGTPENPRHAAGVESKALDLMAPVIGEERATKLIAAVASLDQLGSVLALRRLLRA